MIRVGLVGYGMAGRVFHAPVISAVEGLELAAVVERHSRNAEAAYPGISTYGSLEEMLKEETIQLVVVATPNTSHAALAHQALAAGRHVVVDKPTGITAREIEGLVEATGPDRMLIPFHNRRWDSDFQTLRKLLREEKLGAVVSLESTFLRWRPLARGTWRDDGSEGGGLLLDLGTHLADQAIQLFGLPPELSAEVTAERPGGKVNDAFNIRLYYPDKVITLVANNLTALPRPRYSVRGTKGNYVKWGLDPQEDRLKETSKVEGSNWGLEPSSAWGTLAVDVEGSMITHPVQPIPGDYRLYYAGVRDAILGKSAPPVLATDALKVAWLLEAAEASSREKRTLAIAWGE
jgi:scyllo-inositol 2-dehydrogenase (NADP+)